MRIRSPIIRSASMLVMDTSTERSARPPRFWLGI